MSVCDTIASIQLSISAHFGIVTVAGIHIPIEREADTYVPTPYVENRIDILLTAIKERSFGSLITVGIDGIQVSHIPFVPTLRQAGECILLGHLAQPNDQWKKVNDEVEAVARFVIDSAHISPSWYPSKAVTGKMVPTWNYIAVEARGKIEVVEEPAALLAILDALTDRHEADRPAPWSISDAPEEFTAAMLRGIVGVKLHVREIKGAWKLDQKKFEIDRNGAAMGLAQNGDTSRMAKYMIFAGEEVYT